MHQWSGQLPGAAFQVPVCPQLALAHLYKNINLRSICTDIYRRFEKNRKLQQKTYYRDMAHKSWTVGGSDGHLLQAEIATASSIGQVIALADTRLRFGLQCWASHARELAMRGSKEQAPCLVAFGRQLRHELLGLLPLAQVFQWQFGHQDRNLSFEKSVHKL